MVVGINLSIINKGTRFITRWVIGITEVWGSIVQFARIDVFFMSATVNNFLFYLLPNEKNLKSVVYWEKNMHQLLRNPREIEGWGCKWKGTTKEHRSHCTLLLCLSQAGWHPANEDTKVRREDEWLVRKHTPAEAKAKLKTFIIFSTSLFCIVDQTIWCIWKQWEIL